MCQGTGDRLALATIGLVPGRWGQRVRGSPTSSNGASSFHLWWRLDSAQPLVAVSATLEVVEGPAVDALYFWAMQVGFHDGRRDRGAGHVGLQWLPTGTGIGRPAVNWGGYRAPMDGGGELEGSASALPDAGGSPNTRLYPWTPGRPYRLDVSRRAEGGIEGWRASVTDVGAGTATVIRDLAGPGRWLTTPGVWSEVFARCDDPPVVARWSRLRAVTESGEELVPSAVVVTYQSHADGGCANTTVALDDVGLCQVTGTHREVAHGTVLPLGGGPVQSHPGP